MRDQIGVVFARQAAAPRIEPFFNDVLDGLDAVLANHGGIPLLVKGVPDQDAEIETYGHWARTAAVAAVVVKDLIAGDRRLAELDRLGLPHVVLCDVSQQGGFSALRFDNAAAMTDATTFLVGQGHRTIARVTGPPELVHTGLRTRAFEAACTARGVDARLVAGDYSERSGADAVRRLLAVPEPPTAFVFDNDLMALGAIEAFGEAGVDVPGQASVLAWDDSVRCQLADPALSALSHDVHEMGTQLGDLLLTLLEGGGVVSGLARQPTVVERGSTAPVTLARSARA